VIRCFVLCFSSLVVCLVLYRGCDYFLLGVDVFATVFVHCVQFIYLQNHIPGIVNLHPVFSMKEYTKRTNV